MKTCEHCGVTFGPRPKEGTAFAARRFCGRPCASAFRVDAIRITPERFMGRTRHEPSGCVVWTGSLTAEGYGNLRIPGEDRNDYAHRVSYELHVGAIPEGLVIDHLCRNRACVNPSHLEPVPHIENVRRGLGPYGLRTTCKHGHDVTDPANVYTQPDGGRRCRICARASDDTRRVA